MIIGIQIIGLLFSFSMVYFSVLALKRKELTKVEAYSWFLLWGFAIVGIIFPGVFRTFSMTFLVTRVFDLMVIGGFIVVTTLVSISYLRVKRNEKKLEELVRKLSLKK
jgi:hypothetical protein